MYALLENKTWCCGTEDSSDVSSSIIMLLCKHRTYNLISFYKEFKCVCVPLSKDVSTLILIQGFYLLCLVLLPWKYSDLNIHPSRLQFHALWGKFKVYNSLLCSFPLGLSCKHAIKQNIHRLTPHAKLGKLVRRNNETDSPLQLKGGLKQINLVSLWFCKGSTFPYNISRDTSVTPTSKTTLTKYRVSKHSLAE